jgi:hypothetical protein
MGRARVVGDGPHLICVAPDQVAAFWPHVAPLIAAACRRGVFDLDGCRRSLLEGRALLWLVWDEDASPDGAGGELLAALTTELHRINGRLLCFIAALGGRARGRWLHLIAGIEAFARAEGCAAVVVMGRPGWARALKHYRLRGIILEKGL